MSIRKNISPKIWGNNLWNSLNYIAFAYPENPTSFDKDKFKTFIESLKHLLPCETCRENFDEHTSNFPVNQYLSGPDKIMEWIALIRYQVLTGGKGDDFDTSVVMKNKQKIMDEIINNSSWFYKILNIIIRLSSYIVIALIILFLFNFIVSKRSGNKKRS